MPSNNVIPNKYGIPFLLALIAAGLTGNYFRFPIFLNIDFLFGSIFAMLALQFFGIGRGILAAAMIAGYTYLAWNHPYAIIIMTVEVAVVGWLMGRRKIGMVLADTLYWLVIGMPLVYLFYHLVMHVPPSNTYIIMTKQAVNGIANALVARLIFTGFALRSRSSLMSYSEIINNLLAFFVLCPALIMLALSSRADFIETDQHIRSTLNNSSQHLGHYVINWVENRKSPIINLAEMAVSRSPKQMQPYLEHTKKTDVNFPRVGLLDRTATITAYAPLVDEFGLSNIGISAADRPYVPLLKKSLKPMLSEVLIGKVGTPKPRVFMLAPVVTHGEFGGYVVGVMSLEQVREQFDKSLVENATFYTLLDKNGNVIMTNRADQKVMTPFVRGKGTLNRIDKGISQWVPVVPPNTPISERWKKSFYVAETFIGDLAEWKLILEQPVAPFQKTLYDNYTGKLTLLFLLLLGALALAEFLSRRIVATLGQLRTLTHDLPVRLATDGKDIVWPESGIQETSHLINNFREMAESLSEQFIETRQINESLEQRVEERTKALNTAGIQLSSVVESTGDVVAMMDTEYRYTLFNSAFHDEFKKIFGQDLKPGDSMLQALENLSDDLTNAKEFWNRALFGGEDFTVTQQFGNTKLERNWYELHFSPIRDSEGKVTGAVHIVRNVTERKQAEEQLLEAKAAAESANTAKSQFLANMSHEIRTPMNGILGMTQLLEMSDLTPEQSEYVAALKISGKNLLSLISDILDLSKIEAGKIPIEFAEFGLQQCINDIVLMQKSVAFGKGLKLDVDVAGDIPHLLVGDQLRVKQILLNLLGNAVKFTPEGSVSISAKLLEKHDATVLIQIAVSDTGVGISPEALDKVFMPFTQEDGSTTRKYGGTGLGLTISRRLAELLGGTIAIESSPGVGSCLTVTLPFAVGTSTVTTLAIPSTTVIWDGPPLRILFVEDDQINITFGTSLLRKLGHEFVLAENGRECLAALEQGMFDLVLMDIQMPEMNGEEALREIRRREQGTTYHQPIIALTAYSMRGDKERFLEVGFDGYISKPLTTGELMAETKRVLESRVKE